MNRRQWAALLALTLCGASGVGLAQKSQTSKSLPKQTAKPSQSQPAARIATLDKPVKDFRLEDLADEKQSKIALSQFRGKRPVVLFFMSEHCSVTWQYEQRVGEMVGKFGQKDVQFLGVRCSASDTPQGIVKWAETRNFAMPILNDAKGEMTAYFKVDRTPTFALIDKQGVLRYWGSFDDDAQADSVKQKFLPNAVSAVTRGRSVAAKTNPPFG